MGGAITTFNQFQESVLKIAIRVDFLKVTIFGFTFLFCAANLLIPTWRSELRAQTYGEIVSGIVSTIADAANKQRETIEKRAVESKHSQTEARWGGFLKYEHSKLERSQSELENGFETETPAIYFGVDRWVSENLLVGAIVGLKDSEVKFKNPAGFNQYSPSQLGEKDSLMKSVGIYGCFTPIGDWYIFGNLSYMDVEFETRRYGASLIGTTRGEADGYTLSMGVGSGYGWRFGSLLLGTEMSLGYDFIHLGNYAESGHLHDRQNLLIFDDQEDELFTVKLGGRLYFTQHFEKFSLTPYTRIDYVYRDYPNETSSAVSFAYRPGNTEEFSLDRLDKSSGLASLGLQIHILRNWMTWIEYERNFSEDFFKRSVLSIGVRKDF